VHVVRGGETGNSSTTPCLLLHSGCALSSSTWPCVGRLVAQGGGWRWAQPDSAMTVSALEQAIAQRQPLPGWCITPTGSQYACREYVGCLRTTDAASMSRPANPYDNASCESFMRTLKRKRSTPTLTAIWRICALISRSLSSAITIASAALGLGYLRRKSSNRTRSTKHPARRQWYGASMSFFRHGESIDGIRNQDRSVGAESLQLPAILSMSLNDYSLAGCSPAEPTPLHGYRLCSRRTYA